MADANDLLRQYNCTDNYYSYLCGMVITDGAKAMADKFKCYWLLDIIASYQLELKSEDFQVWQLQVCKNRSAEVLCTDGNDNILKQQHISYTDFEEDKATLWVEGNVILLPSEH